MGCNKEDEAEEGKEKEDIDQHEHKEEKYLEKAGLSTSCTKISGLPCALASRISNCRQQGQREKGGEESGIRRTSESLCKRPSAPGRRAASVHQATGRG